MSDKKLNFVEIKTTGAEDAAIAMPLPKGPYFLIQQRDLPRFKINPTNVDTIRVEEFLVKWGYATYCMGASLEPVLVGWHYDTSD